MPDFDKYSQKIRYWVYWIPTLMLTVRDVIDWIIYVRKLYQVESRFSTYAMPVFCIKYHTGCIGYEAHAFAHQIMGGWRFLTFTPMF